MTIYNLIGFKGMTMVSPRSDILPGIVQTGRYYPATTGWVERSLSPTPIGPIIPQYTGPLPGWNSELFRKDQSPAKLLNWCKVSGNCLHNFESFNSYNNMILLIKYHLL